MLKHCQTHRTPSEIGFLNSKAGVRSGQTGHVLKSLLCWERSLDYFTTLHFTSPETKSESFQQCHVGLGWQKCSQQVQGRGPGRVWQTLREHILCVALGTRQALTRWRGPAEGYCDIGQLQDKACEGRPKPFLFWGGHWTRAVSLQGQLNMPNIPWLSSQDVLFCAVSGI